MNPRRFHHLIVRGLAALLCVAAALPGPSVLARTSAAGPGAPAQRPQARPGVTQFVRGVTVTAEELRLRNRSQAAPLVGPRQANPRRTFSGAPATAPDLTATAGDLGGSGALPLGPDSPQPVADVIKGPVISDTVGFVPPDTMGAVGPTEFLFTTNGRYRAFLKDSPHTVTFNTTDAAFWGSKADPAGVSDTHARYDRATGRWFITEIDVAANDNHILLAVSDGPNLATATWTQYALPGTGSVAAQDKGCFADYDTPGIDQNAIYIGANMFGGNVVTCTGAAYKHSNLYVIQKSSAISGTAHLTTFFNVVTGTVGIATIQGVDSYDALPTGYAIAVKETENPPSHLNVWQIQSPGTVTPTLTGPTAVAIGAENGSLGGVLTLNNVNSGAPTTPMDDLDDRLFAAVIRDGHLWTAHNVAVNASGDSNGSSRNRDAVRWYDLTVAGLTLNQSGTVFDSASSGFLHYWMGTIMPSGQGHVALGLNRANSATEVQAGAVGRLAGDAAGTMRGFTLFQDSTNDGYSDGGNPNRWGDYSYTSLDPCDDMTLWTAQEYVAGSNFGVDWGVAAARLQAPPPATPASASPGSVATGLGSVSVVVTGTSVNGSGFYNTPDTLTDPCRKTISATVSGGVTVNSLSYIDPTHVQLNLSTLAAITGTATITITNPDGQSAGAALLHIGRPTTTALASSLNPAEVGQVITFTATVSGTPGTPAGDVTFSDGAAPLGTVPLVAGEAILASSSLTLGTHSLTAAYGGSGDFAPSTSDVLTETVILPISRPTTTTLASSLNPAFIGQAITLTATVSGTPGLPTGNVTFSDGAAVLGTAPLVAGAATLATSSLSLGAHSLTAAYGGDANFAPSTSDVLTETVQYPLFLPLVTQ